MTQRTPSEVIRVRSDRLEACRAELRRIGASVDQLTDRELVDYCLTAWASWSRNGVIPAPTLPGPLDEVAELRARYGGIPA